MASVKLVIVCAFLALMCALQAPSVEARTTRSRVARESGFKNAVAKAKRVIPKALIKVEELLTNPKQEFKALYNKSKTAILGRMSESIRNKTGKDIDLLDDLEQFEKKVDQCATDKKAKLKELFTKIKEQAMTCAGKEYNELKELFKKFKVVISRIRSIPKDTKQAMKDCKSGNYTSDTTDSEESELDALDLEAETELEVQAEMEDEIESELAEIQAEAESDAEEMHSVERRNIISTTICRFNAVRKAVANLYKLPKKAAKTVKLMHKTVKKNWDKFTNCANELYINQKGTLGQMSMIMGMCLTMGI